MSEPLPSHRYRDLYCEANMSRHPTLRITATGISWKCKYCRKIESVTWERLEQIRAELERAMEGCATIGQEVTS